MAEFDVVILAGGSGRRLGGVDKGALEIGGLPLLDRVLTASARAARSVVVGEARPTLRPVTWTREVPAGGGPVAGLAAGLAVLEGAGAPSGSVEPLGVANPPSVRNSPVLVLATDLPALTAAALDRLLARAGDLERVDAVMFEDAGGHRQPLAALYRADRLRAAVAALDEVAGTSMRRLLGGLNVVTVPDEGATADCDTPDQLRAARAGTPSGAGQADPT